MKKMLSVILILMLLGGVALADKYDDWVKEQYDFENATNAQLETYIKLGQAMVNNAQAELDKRNGSTVQSESIETKEELEKRASDQNNGAIKITDGTVIIDYDGFTVTVEGEPWISDSGERIYIYFTAVAENNSSNDYMISFEDVSINGWEQNGYGFSLVSAGKKARDDCYFYATDAQPHSFDDIEEFSLKIAVLDSDYSTVYETDEIQFTFQ